MNDQNTQPAAAEEEDLGIPSNPRFSQEDARSYRFARLRESRAGISANTRVEVSWRNATLVSSPYGCSNVLLHAFYCAYRDPQEPGRSVRFVCQENELWEFSL